MPLAILLNPDDPLYDFEHMMQHREYFAAIKELYRLSKLPYVLDPAIGEEIAVGPWQLDHQQAHNDFNHNLPSNYNNGYYLTEVTPPPPPPPDPPPPSYLQAHPLVNAGGVGIPQEQILIEGSAEEDLAWWTFINHEEHYLANAAILPLPTTAPTTVGTPPGQEALSNPWWWVNIAPVIFPYW